MGQACRAVAKGSVSERLAWRILDGLGLEKAGVACNSRGFRDRSGRAGPQRGLARHPGRRWNITMPTTWGETSTAASSSS